MHQWNSIQNQQKEICKKFQVDWTSIELDSLIAVNNSLFTSTVPINGLRHTKQKTNGWYLWSGGEINQNDDNFFNSWHIHHLLEKNSIVLKYLGLPPGWRFQIDYNGYEDIWFDKSILDI